MNRFVEKGASMMMLYVISSIFIFILPGSSQEIPLEEILDSMFVKQEEKSATLRTMVYHGTSLYRELTDDGKIKKTTESERIIYLQGRDRQTERYLWMTIDGRPLNETEMMTEVISWQKRGRRSGSPKMPFYPEMRSEYSYELLGSETIDEQETCKIGFTPVRLAPEYAVGTMYISRADHDIVRMESKPAKSSSVVKRLDMVMTFAKEQGYWLLKRFEMQAKIKVKFLITFANVNFVLEDSYSDFRLNIEIPDSLFKNEK